MDFPALYLAVGVAQILSILGGGGIVAFRLGRSTSRMEAAIEMQKLSSQLTAAAIAELKADMAALKTVLTEVALQKAAIERLEHWYDELRHGEGYVYPLDTHLKRQRGE